MNSSIARRIASGAFWSVFGIGVAKIFSFLSWVFTARILGGEAFGDFGLVRSTATAFVTFSTFGMGYAAVKYIAEFLTTDKQRVGRIIGLVYQFTLFSSGLLAAIFYLVAPWICEVKLNAPHLTGEMRLGALLLFLSTFTSAQVGVMAGFQDFRGLAVTDLIVGAVSVPMVAIGAWLADLRGALLAVLLVTLLNLLVNSFFIFRNTKKQGVRYSFRESWRELPLLWKFNLPTLLCTVTYTGGLWLCQMLLRACPGGDAELGIFFAALSIYTIVTFIPLKVSSVFFPMLSELFAAKDAGRYGKTVRLQCFLNIVLIVALALPTALFAPQIMSLFGSGFVHGHGTLAVLCLFGVMFVAGNCVDQIVLSRGLPWLNFSYGLIGNATTIAACYFATSWGYGGFGLAWSLVAGYVARFFVVALCRSWIGRRWPDEERSVPNDRVSAS